MKVHIINSGLYGGTVYIRASWVGIPNINGCWLIGLFDRKAWII